MINFQSVQDVVVNSAWILAAVVGLVEVAKGVFGLASRWVPGVAVVIGIGFSLLVVGWSTLALVVGVIIGLSSVGLYNIGTKTVAGRK